MPAFLTFPVWLAAVQLITGGLLKRWPQFPNQLINVANLLLGLIGYSAVPAAQADTVLSPLGQATNVVLMSLGQQLAVTGIHSTFKNTLKPLLFGLLGLFSVKK